MSNAFPCSRQRMRPGAVLLVVFVLIIMMSLAAYTYLLSMQTEHMATVGQGDQLALRSAAYSARDLFGTLLEQPQQVRKEWGGLEGNPLFAGIPLMEAREPGGAQNETSEALGPRAYVVAPVWTEESGEEYAWGGTNESAKLHLGQLVAWDKLVPHSGRTALMRLPEMDEATADAILDWIDADQESREQGAEADAYAATSASPRNGVPWELEELLLVRGVDRRRLFGMVEPKPAESQTGDGLDRSPVERTIQGKPLAARASKRNEGEKRRGPDGERFRPWSELLTVYSGEHNVSRRGTPRVYANGTQLGEIHAKLLETMPAAWANFVVLYRQFGPGIASGPTVSAETTPPDLSVAARFPIKSLFDLIGVTVVIVPGKTAVSSPFVAGAWGADNPMAQLIDEVTLVPEKRLAGRVNINLAPRAVLLAIPGMTEELAEKIESARQMAGEGAEHELETWPWSEGLIDDATMRTLLPNITAGGDVYRAFCWGAEKGRTSPWGCEIVLDASEGRMRQLYYRDVPASQFALPAAP